MAERSILRWHRSNVKCNLHNGPYMERARAHTQRIGLIELNWVRQGAREEHTFDFDWCSQFRKFNSSLAFEHNGIWLLLNYSTAIEWTVFWWTDFAEKTIRPNFEWETMTTIGTKIITRNDVDEFHWNICLFGRGYTLIFDITQHYQLLA